MNNKVTTADGTETTQVVPDTVRLVASRFFFAYDETYGEFHKRIHRDNPRYAELARIVNSPSAAPTGVHDHRGRLLEAYDVYDPDFRPKGHTLVTVCGGYNGGGSLYKWCEYLNEIQGAVRRLVGVFSNVWLVDLSVHSDIWYATLGFEDQRELPDGGWADDHPPRAVNDRLQYEQYRDRALREKLPLGLVDWGRHGYDWAWAKLAGPYPYPDTAFAGALIRPTDVAGHYAAYDWCRRGFHDALGVYEARNGSQTFYVVASTEPDGFAALHQLAKDTFRQFETAPRTAFQLLEGAGSGPQSDSELTA